MICFNLFEKDIKNWGDKRRDCNQQDRICLDCNGSQWIAMDCNELQQITMDCNGSQLIAMDCNGSQWNATDCNGLQRIAKDREFEKLCLYKIRQKDANEKKLRLFKRTRKKRR